MSIVHNAFILVTMITSNALYDSITRDNRRQFRIITDIAGFIGL